jgi:hypothetical protein
MASESADQALSPAVTSFVICGRTWKLGDPIYSTGVGAIKKKWSNLLAMLAPPPKSKESVWDVDPARNIVRNGQIY